jgi:pyruvate/2-oxoglutarate dehydrogenase complex dihydrolipoamide dehydrogenase (E3) component
VLLAVGRRPNTDDLGVEAAGAATNDHGYIQVDDGLCTNVLRLIHLVSPQILPNLHSQR